MSRAEKLSNAIGNIDDRFLIEALDYRAKSVRYKRIRKLGLAAGMCFVIAAAALLHQERKPSITVYAYGSDQQFTNGKAIMDMGTISDSGNMKGHPVMFYILGHGIESIRFSCKNEWISFADWTEQRDDFGYSKNFTVPYGENEDEYYYLVVDWVPEKIMRKLSEYSDITIADLPPEEKEDIIVMEVSYLDGGSETLAINISLSNEGQFVANLCDYQITEDDDFVFQPDNQPIVRQSEASPENDAVSLEQPSYEENGEEVSGEAVTNDQAADEVYIMTEILSQEEMARVEQVIREYYQSINRKALEIVDTDPKSWYAQVKYDGYEDGEVVCFDVAIENDEAKRRIAVGSKDGWYHCTVLNEGY